jgi:hypothetical protein
MRFGFFKRRRKLSPAEITARCRGCHSELPIMYEQAVLLADGNPVWLFCPACTRIVAAERIVRSTSSSEPDRAPRAQL